MSKKVIDSGLILIGNELLSGQIQDQNLQAVASALQSAGIVLREARVVPDHLEDIAAAINTMRNKYRYLFTTGGVGPTHDDITSEAIAMALGVPLVEHPAYMTLLNDLNRRFDNKFPEMMFRMAWIPQGAKPVPSDQDIVPGYQVENIFVMAGIPNLVRIMLNDVLKILPGGAALQSFKLTTNLDEGLLSGPVAEIVKKFPGVELGIYPQIKMVHSHVELVGSCRDQKVLGKLKAGLLKIIGELGGKSKED